jgi:hypothetical protein
MHYNLPDVILAPSPNAGSDIRLSLPLRKFRGWHRAAASRALVGGQQLAAVAAASPAAPPAATAPPRWHLYALALGEQRLELVALPHALRAPRM